MTTPNLHELIQHSYTLNALHVLTKHEVFDRLVGQSRTAAELAQDVGMDSTVLHDLLALAAAYGYLKVGEHGFHTTRTGLALTRRAGGWIRSYLMVWGEQLQPAFVQLDNFATTGENAFTSALGAPLWDYYGANPEQHQVFVDHMAHVTDQVHLPAIVRELKIGGARSLVDIAGGTGSLLCCLLAAHPGATGTVFDQPRNQAAARARIADSGLQDRADFVGGNMFGSVASGADLYLIKHVLHDWNDDHVGTILSAAAAAMDVHATLVLIEGLMDRQQPAPDPQFLHTRNLEQRVWTEGRLRSSSEFRALCAAAGLDIVQIDDSSIIDMSYLYCRKTPPTQ